VGLLAIARIIQIIGGEYEPEKSGKQISATIMG